MTKPSAASADSSYTSSSSSCASADEPIVKVGKWTREAEAKAVQEIEREDAKRREKRQRSDEEEKKLVNDERIRVRAEIERKVRDKFWHTSNTEFQEKFNQKRQEREHLHLTQGPATVVKIHAVNQPVARVRDQNELTAKFGYNVVYNKMFEGPYWRMLQAKRRDDPDHTFALFIVDVSKVKANDVLYVLLIT